MTESLMKRVDHKPVNCPNRAIPESPPKIRVFFGLNAIKTNASNQPVSTKDKKLSSRDISAERGKIGIYFVPLINALRAQTLNHR
jgi:hypothetical protein